MGITMGKNTIRATGKDAQALFEAMTQDGAATVSAGGVMKQKRGFAVTKERDPARQKEIASMGGKAAHELGRAHEFTPEEAKKAGRKGGLARSRGPKNG